MKHLLILIVLLMSTISLLSQDKDLNERCSDDIECKSGHCVEVTIDGVKKRKCADCDQSTLNSHGRKIYDHCKAFGSGWTLRSSREFEDATADDGLVEAGVFDEMLEKAKDCKEAREDREDDCFGSGDFGHKKAITQVKESIANVVKAKKKYVGERKVFYGSKSSYESKLSTFNSKCKLDFDDIKSDLDDWASDYLKEEKVDCRAIIRYRDDCQKCYDSAKALLSGGFRGSTSIMPKKYLTILNESKSLYEDAKNLEDDADDDDLCK